MMSGDLPLTLNKTLKLIEEHISLKVEFTQIKTAIQKVEAEKMKYEEEQKSKLEDKDAEIAELEQKMKA